MTKALFMLSNYLDSDVKEALKHLKDLNEKPE